MESQAPLSRRRFPACRLPEGNDERGLVEKFKEISMSEMGRLWRDESGSTAVEYSLILAFIAMAVIGGVSLFGKALKEMFNSAGSKFPNG